eukprot:c19003_g1_i4.p1 GENE.c19003_g1_i4~~c19003_g1_i4.p1  ORF type:complete len:652 (+),score=145.10 c19003_g1_i4:44-1999(+)
MRLKGKVLKVLRKPDTKPKTLPIHQVEDEIVRHANECRVLILVGETGSGKTTQMPQILLRHGVVKADRGRSMIAITQPRRVAAVSVAQRVAQEMGVNLGEEVGYTIRFDDKSSNATRIKYMTDGMLVRESGLDPLLSRYSCIILDEAHERSIATDVLIALTKRLVTERSDLRLIVMSATLNVSLFSDYFNNARVLYLQGRQYPVQIYYTPEPEPDYVDATVTAVIQIHLEEAPGDVLVFLTGQEEIDGVESVLVSRAKAIVHTKLTLMVVKIYAALPPEQQLKVFDPTPPGHRKVVLATNIAETSITIPGITYVVDSGLVKSRTRVTGTGADALLVAPISQDAANQRSGRAGRVGPGKCFRLYTEPSFEGLASHTVSEVVRGNMAAVVLQLKLYGIHDIAAFDFIEHPGEERIAESLLALYLLGALDDSQALTPLGQKMASLPVDPPFAACILAAHNMHCAGALLTLVSLLSVENLYFVPFEKREAADAARRSFGHPRGDTLTLLNLWTQYQAASDGQHWCRVHFVNPRALARAAEIRKQLVGICVRQGMDPQSLAVKASVDEESVCRALCSGLFANVATRDAATPNTYVTALGHRKVTIHPSSVLARGKAECVLYCSLVLTTKLYMRDVTVIDPVWVREAAPKVYQKVGL